MDQCRSTLKGVGVPFFSFLKANRTTSSSLLLLQVSSVLPARLRLLLALLGHTARKALRHQSYALLEHTRTPPGQRIAVPAFALSVTGVPSAQRTETHMNVGRATSVKHTVLRPHHVLRERCSLKRDRNRASRVVLTTTAGGPWGLISWQRHVISAPAP